jgi:hypothetical protein
MLNADDRLFSGRRNLACMDEHDDVLISSRGRKPDLRLSSIVGSGLPGTNVNLTAMELLYGQGFTKIVLCRCVVIA